MMKTLDPETTWYHTADPPKSTWKSVKQPAGLMSAYRRTCTVLAAFNCLPAQGTLVGDLLYYLVSALSDMQSSHPCCKLVVHGERAN